MSNPASVEYLEVLKNKVKFDRDQAEKYLDASDPDLERVTQLIGKVSDTFDVYSDTHDEIVRNHHNKSLKLEDYKDYAEAESLFKILVTDQLTALYDKRKVLKDRIIATSTKTAPSSPKVKYPTINLLKFNGDKTKWDAWWQGYNSMVHSKAELDKVTKFTYLLTSLEGEGRKCVERFQITEKGYDLAVKALETKYSDPEASKRILVRKLLDIKSPSVNKLDLENFKEDYLSYSHQLELLNITVEDSEWLIQEHLFRKLPQPVCHFICDKADTLYPSIEEILDNITLYISRHNLNDKGQVTRVDTPQQVPKLEGKQQQSQKKSPPNWRQVKSPKATKTLSIVEKSSKLQYTCIFCKGDHSSKSCTDYPTKQQRMARLKTLDRCSICCRSHPGQPCVVKISPCYNCQGTHHSWLCDKFVTAKNPLSNKTDAHVVKGDHLNAALPTATVDVANRATKESVTTRVFFDQGSQKTFISQSLAKRLKLRVTDKVKLQLSGFTGTAEEQEYDVVRPSIKLGRRVKSVTAVVIKDLPSNITTPGLKRTVQKLARSCTLADRNITSDTVDHIGIIIGSEYYGRFVTGLGKKEGVDVLITPGGLVVYGPIPFSHGTDIAVRHVSVYHMAVQSEAEVNHGQDLIPKMWDLTNMGIAPEEHAVDDDAAYDSYLKTVQYVDQKYWVRLPWKQDSPPLPSNLTNAKVQLSSQLAKLRREPQKLKVYESILTEQLKLGFIEKCETITTVGEHHYLPHHGVAKDSLSTPLRLVYNAASKATKESASLNDCLMKGPNLTKKLLDILVRFRSERFAYSADISKAFLRLGLQECDRDFVRFLWSANPSDPAAKLVAYRFKSVLFGATSSPFLLQVTLDLHLRKSTGQHRDTILHNFYVDNLLGTSSDQETLVEIYKEANCELSKADMPLRSWTTNSPTLTKLITKETGTEPFEDEQNILGLNWSISRDSISVKSVEQNAKVPITKRAILSRVSSLFDPLGLVSPLTIKGKLLVQAAWQLSVDWDENLPEEFLDKWPEIEHSLQGAGSLSFPRAVITETADYQQLHIFCDASSKAYGACAYVTTNVDSNLLMSKAKVAPLKSRTLPQLELMALLVGARLAKYIVTTFNKVKFAKILIWSDNEACIQWVRNNKSDIVFVKNRVAEIRELTANIQIHHVDTKQNPADLLTRGVDPEVLCECPLWFRGPEWLLDETEWPPQKAALVSIQAVQALNIAKNPCNSLFPIENYSSLQRVLSITKYMFRFLRRVKPDLKLPLPLQYWIGLAQREHYPGVFSILHHHVQPLKSNTNLKLIRDLGLYEEEGTGLLRSRGRLQRADLATSTKLPMLVPNKSHLAKLIVMATHLWTLHGGVQDVLVSIRQWCWIPKGRQLIKTLISKCTLCRRYEGQQIERPGPPVLPVERLVVSRPFENTGVDYTGAITVKDDVSGEPKKVYIALFTCMVTRNIHLEVASDLSAITFLNVFRRFAASCSLPQKIVSDNGTNLCATARFLKDLLHEEDVQNYLEGHNISWQFIHVRSPWEGGFYERLIGVTKSCLKKVLYRRTLTLQELTTIVAEVKARINNRPLTYVSSELQPLQSLTPAHLVYGRRIVTMPPLEPEDELDLTYELDQRQLYLKFTHLSKVLRKFEQVFEQEYLTALREKHYGNNPACTSTPLKVGDVVLVEAGNNRESWPIGRVTELLPDQDNVVRAVKVFSQGRESVRTVGKLVPLEITEPAPSIEPIDEELTPDEPEVTAPVAQRPRRAAADRATKLFRQLVNENRL